jgi:hypothetical protein
MRVEKNAKTGKYLPVPDGEVCPACGHEIPGSANTQWHHPTVQGGDTHKLADNRTDILYMTGPGAHDDHWLTLHTLDGFPPHIMLLLTTYLRDKARDAAGRAELANYGIGVVSTHDEPDSGYVAPATEVQALLSRVLKS